MTVQRVRWFVTRHPVPVVIFWVVLTLALVLGSPDLTKLAAEGQANLVPKFAESSVAAALVRETWPDQSYQCTVVLGLKRVSKLTSEDQAIARRLAQSVETSTNRPKGILRVMGPDSRPEISTRLVSADGTMQLIVVPLETSFVDPRTYDLIDWIERTMKSEVGKLPEGLETLWTGDALIGREYMLDVQRSLDRAAVITVVLLLAVLMAVYRSFLLAMIPLSTIGVGLLVSRSALAWMVSSGSIKAVFLVSLSPCKIPFTCLLCSLKTATTFLPLLKLSSISALYPALANLLKTLSNTRLSSFLFLYKLILILAKSSLALSFTLPVSSIISSIKTMMFFS